MNRKIKYAITAAIMTSGMFASATEVGMLADRFTPTHRDVDAKPLAKQMPNATYQQIAQANHFSFLGICKPQAKAILAEEGEGDPLCDLPTGAQRSREQVHQALIDTILTFLQRRDI